MDTRGQAHRYLRERRKAGAISKHTAVDYRYVLDGFADVARTDPAKLDRRDVLRWLRTISARSANTRRHYVVIVRGFTRWLQKRGVLGRDPFAELAPPRAPRSVHRALDASEVHALLDAATDERARLIILLGLHTGLRRAELAALEVADVSLAGRVLTVRRGKGGDARQVPLSVEVAAVLADYLAANDLRSGPLLRSKRSPNLGVSPATVGEVFTDTAVRAGVKRRAWDGVGCHSTRHTMATDVYLRTRDVMAVRDLLGHANLSTTQGYVRGLGVEQLRGAVDGRRYLGAA